MEKAGLTDRVNAHALKESEQVENALEIFYSNGKMQKVLKQNIEEL